MPTTQRTMRAGAAVFLISTRKGNTTDRQEVGKGRKWGTNQGTLGRCLCVFHTLVTNTLTQGAEQHQISNHLPHSISAP